MNVIKYGDIPEYLKDSAFFVSLSATDTDCELEIPTVCLKNSDDVQCANELGQLFRTMKFWGVDTIPKSVCEFCFQNKCEVWYDVALDTLGEESSIFSDLVSVFGGKEDKYVLSLAIECDRQELIEYLISTPNISPRLGLNVTSMAAKKGRLDTLTLLHQHGFHWDADTTAEAAENGHLSCLQYAHEQGCRWDESIYAMAALNGHLHCIEYAHQQGLEPHENLCTRAIDGGQLHCLQYGFEHDFPWDCGLTSRAAEVGSAECLQYVLENGCDIEVPHASDAACKNGDLECLQLLCDYGMLLTTRCAALTAQEGHLHSLRYLHEQGCPWDCLTVEWAAGKGHTDILRYALSNNCPYRSNVACFAAQAGSLSCLQYLVEERGVSVSREVFGKAFVRAHIDCVNYLLDRACPCDFVFGGESEWMYYGMHTKPFGVSLDDRMLQCVVYAVQHGWQHNKNFADYIVEYCSELPRCLEHVKSVGWLKSE